MKKFALVSACLGLLISCSLDPVVEPKPKLPTTFEVVLDIDNLKPGVDEMVTVKVKSEEPLKEVSLLGENVTRTLSAGDPDGVLQDNLSLYFQFESIGIRDIKLEFLSKNGIKATKNIQFEVQRGNTVKITGVEVVSFYNMGETWDPEFDDDDPERLADLQFVMEKLMHSDFTDKEFYSGRWHISSVHENEESLFWDLDDEELYINPKTNGMIKFGLIDNDGENMEENLLVDHIYRDFSFYFTGNVESKRETVSLIDENIDLHVKFHLEWPEP